LETQKGLGIGILVGMQGLILAMELNYARRP